MFWNSCTKCIGVSFVLPDGTSTWLFIANGKYGQRSSIIAVMYYIVMYFTYLYSLIFLLFRSYGCHRNYYIGNKPLMVSW